jgi:predicted aminopeptidase
VPESTGKRERSSSSRRERGMYCSSRRRARPGRRLKLLHALASALALAVLPGCTTGQYLAQAGCGQIDIMLRARDLEAAMRDPKVPARTGELLGLVPAIKKFGEENSLRPTGNYHTYVDLERPAVVWVVTASEPLRFRPKTWWFPIVGRVPYLGWFDRGEAQDFAAGLREQGWDADIGASEAYSTLGWFDDPVLSTMLSDGDEAVGELVNVVLHESVHATLYVDGQTRFNESLAEFAAGKLTVTYLDGHYGPDSGEKRAYIDAEERGEARHAQMHRAYEKLARLYASHLADAQKLAVKRRLLVALRAETRFRRPINNATLAAFKNYNSGAPQLDALLDACGWSFARFFRALGAAKKKDAFTEPNQADLAPLIYPLVKAGCPG